VEYILIEQNNLEFPQLKDISAQLAMSERQVQRTLKKENTSFQQLLEKARKEFAISYLEDNTFRISEVAFMLGYNGVSAFTRSFKRWRNGSPTISATSKI
jgi:AraC-like DNA-binding protein